MSAHEPPPANPAPPADTSVADAGSPPDTLSDWLPLQITLDGPCTGIESELCSVCPRGPRGCCSLPPNYTLQEVGLVAAAPGGEEWLRAEIGAGRLWVEAAGLRPASDNWGCAYLTRIGCRCPRPFRPAQCNFYICPEAISAAGLTAETARYPRWVRDMQYQRRQQWSQMMASVLERRGLLPLDPEQALEWLRLLAKVHRSLARFARKRGREFPSGKVVRLAGNMTMGDGPGTDTDPPVPLPPAGNA